MPLSLPGSTAHLQLPEHSFLRWHFSFSEQSSSGCRPQCWMPQFPRPDPSLFLAMLHLLLSTCEQTEDRRLPPPQTGNAYKHRCCKYGCSSWIGLGYRARRQPAKQRWKECRHWALGMQRREQEGEARVRGQGKNEMRQHRLCRPTKMPVLRLVKPARDDASIYYLN